MKTLSRWASRHPHLAILGLISCEVINACNGLLLGANSLDGGSGAASTLLIGALLGAIGVRLWPCSAPLSYQARRWRLFGAFGLNFLLFVALGGLWAGTVTDASGPHKALAGQRAEIAPDTLPAYYATPESTVSQQRVRGPRDDRQAGKRIFYVLLFLLSIFLTSFAARLACQIACAGYGFLAVLTFLLGLGFTAGGIFFLGRATDKPLKPIRDLSRPERRRAFRRFWLAWLLLIGLFVAVTLIAAAA